MLDQTMYYVVGGINSAILTNFEFSRYVALLAANLAKAHKCHGPSRLKAYRGE